MSRASVYVTQTFRNTCTHTYKHAARNSQLHIYTIIKTTSVGDARLSVVGVAGWLGVLSYYHYDVILIMTSFAHLASTALAAPVLMMTSFSL